MKKFSIVTSLTFILFSPSCFLFAQSATGASAVSSYKASQTIQGILLQWSVDSVRDNSYFAIEHSTDGNTFTALVSLPAKRSMNDTAYSYTDINPSQGNNYYRLLQYNVAGKVKDYGIQQLTIKSQQGAYVYPNPITAARVTIYLGHAIDKPVLYQIADMMGAILQRGILTNSVQTIDVNNLSKGYYILKLNTGETIQLDKK